MSEKNVLFVTSRPSRANDLSVPSVDLEAKKMLEETWARNLGIDVEKLRDSAQGTESTSNHSTTSASMTGTDTGNGGDITTDHQSDSESDSMTDDIHNDGGSGTGGIVDVPF